MTMRDEYWLAWAGIENWTGADRRHHDIPDDLAIPEFLRRDPSETKPLPAAKRRREKKIAYPTDGYACKGMRSEARERHRARLRRRAERMRRRHK